MQILKTNSDGSIVVKDKNGNIVTLKRNIKKIGDYSKQDLEIIDNQISYNTQLLCINYPYHGFITMTLSKKFTDEINTMAVYIDGLYHCMLINPYFWEELMDKHRTGLLLHEISHIAFFHTLVDASQYEYPTLLNIAMDMVVNQYIDNLPHNCVSLDKFKELNLERDQSFEYYYEKLMNDYQNNHKSKSLQSIMNVSEELNGNGESIDGMTIDINGTEISISDHSKYGQNSNEMRALSETEQNVISDNLVYVLSEAAEAAKQAGNMPGKFLEVLEKIKNPKKPRYNYHTFLRKFAGNSGETNVVNTRMRPNLLIPKNPGTRTEGMPNVLIAWDVSGSMSKRLLTSLQVDLLWMVRQGYPVTLLQFDTCITNVSPYKRGMEISVKGRGGTDFQSVYNYFADNQNVYTCMIVFSDGYADAPKQNTHVRESKILWCLTNKNDDTFPGKKVFIDEDLNEK